MKHPIELEQEKNGHRTVSRVLTASHVEAASSSECCPGK